MDATSGLLISTFEGHTDTVNSCRFFPDGKTVVSASCDYTLKVWDVATGSLVRTLVGHTSYVLCVEVSPDNTRILSTSFDNTWNCGTPERGNFSTPNRWMLIPTAVHSPRTEASFWLDVATV